MTLLDGAPALVDGARRLRVVVIGDVVLDGWLSGPTSRLSREAPVPVVDITETTYAPGGAGNTAANLAALGAAVTLLSVTGDDADGALVRDLLSRAGVATDDVLVLPGRTTAAKRRVSAGTQMLTRCDTGDSRLLSGPVRLQVLQRLAEVAADADAVVVSDYALGLLGEDAVAAVAALRHPCVVVDARAPTRWAGARPRAVKPNFVEVTPLLDVGLDRAERVVAAEHAVLEALGAQLVAVTLDGDGTVLLGDGEPVRVHTRRMPDTHAAGAGDSFVAGLTVALAQGASPRVAVELAQRAAQVVVQRPGTTPCTAAELRAAVTRTDRRLVDLERLHDVVRAHREAGRTVGFTNGCFDGLHAGHVAHLSQARRVVDVLVVGLNSDASVARLKGDGRPWIPVHERAAMLTALSGVDHVVVFDADTPAELLEVVRPDVYVKGGDYTAEMLPETPLVERLGGTVRTLGYVEHTRA